jgi:hypothetical protein
MKAVKILALAVGVVFLARDPAAARRQEVIFRHESTLSFKTCLFEADLSTGLAPEQEKEPKILLLTQLFGGGLSEKPAGQLESLKSYFRLPELALKEESGEIEITWEVYEEGRNKKDEIKKDQKISQVAELDGDRYTIFIIPREINIKDNLYRFLIEIHRNKTKETGGLFSMELLVSRELLWNFRGPLAVGFFFPDKIYFLTFTIWAGWSNSGPRLGSAMAWII